MGRARNSISAGSGDQFAAVLGAGRGSYTPGTELLYARAEVAQEELERLSEQVSRADYQETLSVLAACRNGLHGDPERRENAADHLLLNLADQLTWRKGNRMLENVARAWGATKDSTGWISEALVTAFADELERRLPAQLALAHTETELQPWLTRTWEEELPHVVARYMSAKPLQSLLLLFGQRMPIVQKLMLQEEHIDWEELAALSLRTPRDLLAGSRPLSEDERLTALRIMRARVRAMTGVKVGDVSGE